MRPARRAGTASRLTSIARLRARLLEGNGASLAERAVRRLDERHRAERRPARDLRLGVVLDRAHQLAHRALEGVREPALLPARLLPRAVELAGRPVDRRRAAVRVVRPADRPLRHAFRALDPPVDAVVDPREAVVEPDRAQAVGVLEDVERHPVLVREVVARVGPRRDEDPLGIAEQEPEGVQVVDRHVQERDLPVGLDELLPVRPGVHDDLRDDRRPQLAAVEQRLQRPHRLVVAHVVVDAELLPGLVADLHHLDGFLERERDGLLRQDPLHVRPARRLADDLELLVGRDRRCRRSRRRGSSSSSCQVS